MWVKTPFGEGDEYKKFWQILKLVVREEIETSLNAFFEQQPDITSEDSKEKLVSMKELCFELKVSRQTIHNWFKNKSVNWLLDYCRKNLGGKIFYDLTGIKKAIKTQPNLFGGSRNYKYKDEVCLTAEQRFENRYKGIKASLVFKQPVSVEDLEWFNREDKRLKWEERKRQKFEVLKLSRM
jgi:hypothetical protein